MYSASGRLSNDDLVTRYTPLVKRIAYHLIGRLPASVQVDDLIQAGMIGLLDAATHYDERQGASFETYATIRVRGAMLDELRRNDWAPKSVHRRGRELAEAIHHLEGRLGRDATDTEIAEEMGIPLAEYHEILQDISTSRMVSLNQAEEDEEGSTHAIIPSDGPAPMELLQQQRFQQGLAKAIEQLPERERLILALYYDKELNLKEIGAILKVTESRISQLMSQAHLRLRARLRDWLE